VHCPLCGGEQIQIVVGLPIAQGRSDVVPDTAIQHGMPLMPVSAFVCKSCGTINLNKSTVTQITPAPEFDTPQPQALPFGD
jgi:hypothetical protein